MVGSSKNKMCYYSVFMINAFLMVVNKAKQ